FEHPFGAMLGFVLRFAGTQGFRQIVPEFEESCIEHFENAADVPRAVAVQIQLPRRSVKVLGVASETLTVEELHSHQRIEKVNRTARMQAQLLAKFLRAKASSPKFGEEAEFDCGEQDFGTPKGESSL